MAEGSGEIKGLGLSWTCVAVVVLLVSMND